MKLKINFIAGGETYSDRGYIVSTYTEISEEEYQRLSEIPNLTYEYEQTLSDAIRCGYGFYGCGIIRRNDGKYFFYDKIGSSCD